MARIHARLLPLFFIGSVAFAQPLEVASGEDLVAWQMLEHQRLHGESAVLAYRSFVETYDRSPLAVAAFGRLVSLDAPDNWGGDGASRQRIASVRARWAQLDAALRATDAAPAPAVALTSLISDEDATVLVDSGRPQGEVARTPPEVCPCA